MCLLLQQVQLAVDGALTSAEALAEHGILPSMGYERLIDYLMQAQDAADRLDALLDDGNPFDLQPANDDERP
jgi:hypothetical protein